MDDFYRLGCRPGDPPEKIEAAYRKLARKFHPDTARNPVEAQGILKEINAARDRIRKGTPMTAERDGFFSHVRTSAERAAARQRAAARWEQERARAAEARAAAQARARAAAEARARRRPPQRPDPAAHSTAGPAASVEITATGAQAEKLRAHAAYISKREAERAERAPRGGAYEDPRNASSAPAQEVPVHVASRITIEGRKMRLHLDRMPEAPDGKIVLPGIDMSNPRVVRQTDAPAVVSFRQERDGTRQIRAENGAGLDDVRLEISAPPVAAEREQQDRQRAAESKSGSAYTDAALRAAYARPKGSKSRDRLDLQL